MPHLVVSYAKPLAENIDIRTLAREVWNGADESGLFLAPDIKVRLFAVEDYINGVENKPFVHVDFMLYVGRNDDQKKHMNKCVFDRIAALVSDDVAISILPIDMDKPNYLKRG